MKAAVFRKVGTPMEVEEVSISKPAPREVLIRTSAAGLCHSDLHVIDGKSYPPRLPMVLGHESAGIVEQVGSEVRGVVPGDHVITCLSVFCGHCEQCLSGHMNRCFPREAARSDEQSPRLEREGQPIGQYVNMGSFAEQMLIHEHGCVAIRKDMPLDRACLIGCGVTTGVGAVIHTSQVKPGDSVAVIGCGGVGLATINGAFIAGAGRIIAIDVLDSKLELAKTFGATDVVNARGGDPVEQVRELTGGGVNHSFEVIGLKQTAEQAFRMLARGGTANIIGVISPGVKLELEGVEFLMERKLQGSLMGSNRFPIDMPRYIELYMQGRLKLDELISQRIGLGDVNEAFDELRTGALARSVVMFDA